MEYGLHRILQTMLQLDEAGDELDRELRPELYDKDELVRAHQAFLLSMEQFQPRNQNRMLIYSSISEVEGDRPTSTALPLHRLRPILVRHLTVGCHHKDRVLYGELCVEPGKIVSVQTIIIDEEGHAAKLSVYNSLPTQNSERKMGALFRKGLKLAVKEPYFKIAMDGSLMIRVDNPADIVRNPKGRKNPDASKTVDASQRSTSSVSPGPFSARLSESKALREQGNKAFIDQEWKLAVQLYSDAVKALAPLKDWLQGSSSSSEVIQELVLGFSNRAEARLRLRHFEAAERDAESALQLQNNHLKSIARRARALHELHRYKEAAVCYEAALRMGGDEDKTRMKDLSTALKRNQTCERQARTGKYDLLDMWTETQQGREPVCGEYMGPVEIGPASDSNLHRGLFVTRDVKPGDLLIVSRALAHTDEDPFSMTLLSEVERSRGCTDSKSLSMALDVQCRSVSSQIVERALTSKRFRQQVIALISTEKNNIPPMDLFISQPTVSESIDEDEMEDIVLDVESINMATRRNAFKVAEEPRVTLWLIPSFINHSCVPNACWMTVGKEVLMVRASRHLAKGQEIFISYLDNAAVPLSTRAGYLQHCREFACRCERCSFERTMEPFLRRLELMAGLQPLDIVGAAEIVEMLEWAFGNVAALVGDSQKQRWLSASFAASYELMAGGDAVTHRRSKAPPAETVLMAVKETLGASEHVLAKLSQRVDFEDCSSSVQEILQSMYISLYGKYKSSTFTQLAALRGGGSCAIACYKEWQRGQTSMLNCRQIPIKRVQGKGA